MFSKALIRPFLSKTALRRSAAAAAFALSGGRSLHSISSPALSSTGSNATYARSAALLLGAGLFLSTVASNTANCDVEKKEKAAVDKWAHTALYGPIEPYHTGYLKVSDIHTIYYASYGNPNGKPVLFIHGGPGGGTTPAMARFFDPSVYRIILVDQRGCGHSTPFANLTDNTTYDSVRDFEKLRKHLGINKWQLFGGSWGSTLALAYAVR
jgi:hypothetical protein